MFSKILENIQFHHIYKQKLHYYIKNEAKESRFRQIGFILITLAFVVQLFALAFPPKSNAAPSPNDLITGGVSSKQQIVDDCNNNNHYVGLIYGWYGVSCKDIAAASSVVVNLNSTDYSGSLWSVGHLPYGLPSETPQTVWGSTLYWRMLHSWDTNGSSNYTALKVTADNGHTYFILFACGNLVSIGFPVPYSPPAPTPAPVPVPPKPKPTPCPYNSLITNKDAACRPCAASQSVSDAINCLNYSKTASNVTRSIANANDTTANAGDVISYTLTVKNSGKLAVSGYVIQESVADILNYADLQNVNGAKYDSKTGILSWPAVNIPAKGSVSKTFTTAIKNPIPKTAAGKDDPSGFNMVMTDVYGNAININLKASPGVVVVQAAKTLPNTGPGTNILFIFIITSLAGYFYYRSKLLTREAVILDDLTNGGN